MLILVQRVTGCCARLSLSLCGVVQFRAASSSRRDGGRHTHTLTASHTAALWEIPGCKNNSLVIISMSYSVSVKEAFVEHGHFFTVQGPSASCGVQRERTQQMILYSHFTRC